MRKRTICTVCLCMAMAVFSLQTLETYASSISDIKKQQEEDKKKLGSVQGQISGIQGKKNELEGEIEEIDTELVEIIASVDIIKEEITAKEAQIVETQAKYEEAKLQEEEQYEAMKLRIKFMYEQGEISYLQIFLTSDNLSEMMNKADFVEALYAYDRKMLEEYQATKELVEAYWNQLEDEKSELEAAQHELEEEQAYMETVLEEKKAESENYGVQLARAQQEAAAYKTRIKQQNAQIKQLEEEAAKKRAAEEAKRKAAEEEAKKKSASGTQGTSGTTEGDTGGGDSSDTSSDSSSSESAPPPSSGGSASGQGIANYACEFIGNPYVAGGTSLTNGADCSGFVWRVFQDKGYSVPRTSWELRNAGSGVEYSQAQPGDIICYAGHVGIYIGGGNIVHASTERTGIKITSATYKAIIGVRRVA